MTGFFKRKVPKEPIHPKFHFGHVMGKNLSKRHSAQSSRRDNMTFWGGPGCPLQRSVQNPFGHEVKRWCGGAQPARSHDALLILNIWGRVLQRKENFDPKNGPEKEGRGDGGKRTKGRGVDPHLPPPAGFPEIPFILEVVFSCEEEILRDFVEMKRQSSL